MFHWFGHVWTCSVKYVYGWTLDWTPRSVPAIAWTLNRTLVKFREVQVWTEVQNWTTAPPDMRSFWRRFQTSCRRAWFARGRRQCDGWTNLITYLTNVEGFVYVLRAPQKDLCLRCMYLASYASTYFCQIKIVVLRNMPVESYYKRSNLNPRPNYWDIGYFLQILWDLDINSIKVSVQSLYIKFILATGQESPLRVVPLALYASIVLTLTRCCHLAPDIARVLVVHRQWQSE